MSRDGFEKVRKVIGCTVTLGLLLASMACGSSPSGSTTGTPGPSSAVHQSGSPSSGSSSGSGSPTTSGTPEPPTSGATSGSAGSGGANGGSGNGPSSGGPLDGGASPNMAADGGAGEGGAVAAEGGMMPPPHPDLGKGDGSDVVLMGDSWMSNTLQIEGTNGGIAPSLQQVAMQPYRNYAVQGVMMLMADSFGPAIPTQWTQAKAANPNVKTVVMTGGGNDIIQGPANLQTDCQQGGDLCKMTLQQISDAFNTLWTQMASDGVQDVLLIQYSANTGKVAPSLRSSAPTPAICTSGKIRCWQYDTTPDVAMSDLALDGIHPLQAANDRIATHVYALMTQDGMRR